MNLVNILNNVTNVAVQDCEIKNITLDSRQAKPGFLFCAINGYNVDARKFIPQAIEQGVSVILAGCDDENEYVELIDGVQVIHINNLYEKLSLIAGNFYNHPSKGLSLVGITGTNGKTTIAQIVAQWTYLLGRRSASMGTIGNGFYGEEISVSDNTTGSAFDVQKNLRHFRDNKANVVTMEVSSHGLVQGRVDAVDFDVAVFNNLTQDHLDYHKTMDSYFEAKTLLFTKLNPQYKIINIDDEYGRKLLDLIEDKSSIIAVSTKQVDLEEKFEKFIYVKSVQYSNKGTYISFKSNLAESVITTQLIGPFNVCNVLMGLAIMLAAGYNPQDVIHAANNLKPVVGRMEIFKKTGKASIIVDYAHTPDALEKAIQATLNHTLGQLWCIFGCGGDRDATKRPLMAQAAEKFADRVIITNDNPRTENSDKIIEDIKAGLSNPDKAIVIKNRFEAIEHASQNASSKDMILVAGKGHEDYQIIGTEKLHYSDRESAKTILNIK
jgi:UDP-N-acetylmuramoyl-L-alanyl-D-glutamate--2,6-diaminopimelate ligase